MRSRPEYGPRDRAEVPPGQLVESVRLFTSRPLADPSTIPPEYRRNRDLSLRFPPTSFKRLARLSAACFAWIGLGAGCGDETRCPDGLEGTPCRYVEAPRIPPVVPPISVVSDALVGDTSGADADATTNDGLSSDGSGDAGPDVDPDDVRQDGEADVGAHIETPNAHAVARFAFASGDGPLRRQVPSLSPCRPATATACESGMTLARPFPFRGSAV